MSASEPNPIRALAERVQGHVSAREQFYAEIDDAVAAAAGELEQARVHAEMTNPQLYADHTTNGKPATHRAQ